MTFFTNVSVVVSHVIHVIITRDSARIKFSWNIKQKKSCWAKLAGGIIEAVPGLFIKRGKLTAGVGIIRIYPARPAEYSNPNIVNYTDL